MIRTINVKNLYMLNDGAGGGGYPIQEQSKDQKQKAKFKLNLWYGLSLRIIALFVTAIIVSYTPELFRDIFGDKPYPEDGRYHRTGFIDEEWNWGYRHYLYFLMCLCLFIVQAVRLGMWIDKNKDDFKP